MGKVTNGMGMSACDWFMGKTNAKPVQLISLLQLLAAAVVLDIDNIAYIYIFNILKINESCHLILLTRRSTVLT